MRREATALFNLCILRRLRCFSRFRVISVSSPSSSFWSSCTRLHGSLPQSFLSSSPPAPQRALSLCFISCLGSVVFPTYQKIFFWGNPISFSWRSCSALSPVYVAGKEWNAGALVAFASAIKAFPVLAIGYLVYRRHWKATLSTLVFLILLLVVASFAVSRL